MQIKCRTFRRLLLLGIAYHKDLSAAHYIWFSSMYQWCFAMICSGLYISFCCNFLFNYFIAFQQHIITKQGLLSFTGNIQWNLIAFVGGLKKKQWIWENNRCGSHSLNRIRSGTIEIEWRIRENELPRNDRGFTVFILLFSDQQYSQ
jgi:hypothetical protein